MYVFCWGQVVFPGAVAGAVPSRCRCGAAAVPARCGRIETVQGPMKNCLGAPKRNKIQRKITRVCRNGIKTNENANALGWSMLVGLPERLGWGLGRG